MIYIYIYDIHEGTQKKKSIWSIYLSLQKRIFQEQVNISTAGQTISWL